MKLLAIFENPEINIGQALIISLIAILIVFGVLAVIIFISWLFQVSIHGITSRTHILPKEENKILDQDEDAVVAVIAATIDFHKETGKNPEVISVTKVED